MSAPGLKRVLGTWDLVLFNIVVIFSLRGMATAAKTGWASLILWALAVGAFFVPLGYAVTELATRDPGQGGLYRWTRSAFGDAHGFICGWLYWITNLTYLPSLLFFLAGNVVYVVGRPELGNDPWFVLPLALGVLWFSAWLNVIGLSMGQRLTNMGATANWVSALLLVAAGAVALVKFGSATPLRLEDLGSSLLEPRTVAYFGTMSFALVGLELAPIMGGEIKDPRRSLPRAILLSGGLVAALYLLGTVAILAAVPPAEVSPISGGLGAVEAVSAHAGWGWLPVVAAALVSFAAVGGVGAWLGGQARLPYSAGLDRFVPDAFARLHPRYGTPHVSVWVQTALTSVLILASQAGSSVKEAYLVLLDMTIVMNFVPFIYIFLALRRLRPNGVEPQVVRVPGGRAGLHVVSLLGLLATGLTLVTAAIPPSDIEQPWVFEAKLWGGLFLFAALGWLVFRGYGKSRGSRAGPVLAVILAAGLTSGCNRGAEAPSPRSYDWPEAFSYRLEYVSETQRDTVALLRYEEIKTLFLLLRDDRYLVWHDSVLKQSRPPAGGPPQIEALWPEDTLDFYVRLGPRGEITEPVPGCDPALPACQDALPSAVPLELRRLFPRLPVWEAPRGAEWRDSTAYDDLPRPRGTRGYVVTAYRAMGDTVISGRSFWMIQWRSLRQSFGATGIRTRIIADVPVEEEGITLVDKTLLLPAYSSWAGAVGAPEAVSRRTGATGTGFRGRAYLLGSPFDRMINQPQ